MPNEQRPAWAQRIVSERETRGWTQQRAIDALRLHSPDVLPDDTSLLRTWKGWEAGKHLPRPDTQKAIALAFGTVSAAIFGPDTSARPVSSGDGLVLPAAGETLELVQRIRRSDVDAATLDTLSVTVERICSEYARMPSDDLRREGQAWMARLTRLLDGRLTLTQHREVLVLAGWLALVIGCVEYDMNDVRAAEATRKAAWQLGHESGNAEIMAWAQEMRCWFALTQGRYREVIEAARIGWDIASHHGVAVQLAGQEAKAWARMGDRRQVELALERGRVLLESLPYPDNIENHFAVDPDKFDYYAMDCFRRSGDDNLAQMHALEVIRKCTSPDGTQRSPMRIAEAELTLGVVAAREGDLEGAVAVGGAALEIPRQSVPHLLMVARDLLDELGDRYGNEPAVRAYQDRVHELVPTR